jgi:Domain of unknown function (DUF2760)
MVALIGLVLGALLGAGQYYLLTTVLGVDLTARPEYAALFAAGPAAIGLVMGLLAGRGGSAAATPSAAADETPAEPEHASALRLLALLQEEGRLIDFLTEDVGPYSDEQVGAATRSIHESCAKALRDAFALEPIMSGEEEADVTVEPGFDPAAVRLTGNVSGEPPFSGVLRHAGWRVTSVTLPARAGIDPHVLAAAEVEIA